MAKQQSIPGTESEEYIEINEAAEELRIARADQKRAGERVSKAMSNLCQRMMKHKKKVYEYRNPGHERFRLDLTLPEPTVKMVFVGKEEE